MTVKNKEMVSLLVRGIPRHIRQRFKYQCYRSGQSMTKEIIEFMRRFGKHGRGTGAA